MKRMLVTGLACTLGMGSLATAPAAEIGFLESFSLAPDRTVPLQQLIPGTEDFYYYHALHYQNTEQWDRVEPLLKLWIARHNTTARVIEIQNRQALLRFPHQSDETLALIRRRLQLHFPHQREQLNQKSNFPTVLDPALLSRSRLNQLAFEQSSQTLDGFTDTALDWLVATPLSPEHRRQLLTRLQRPDYPNLVSLIIADLSHAYSGGFGSLEIHKKLLLNQLDECVKLRPSLRNEQNFVHAYLVRLQPSADVNWRQDRVALDAYLTRLWTFVQTLGPVHNSLKAHVLYQQLVLDRSNGVYNADRFLAYIKLPRQMFYVEPRFLEREQSRQSDAVLTADFSMLTGLPTIGNDEPLVRSYLEHFFLEAKDHKQYLDYIRDSYLSQLFAETKLVNGLGDPEQWFSMLPPEQIRQLKDRIDLNFAFTNKTEFNVEDPVALDLDIKNVQTLIVKVFEINTQNFYREHGTEVGPDINLDGLVANEQKTYTYTEPPLRKVRRHFEFPQLNRRGVYVIDFIGNGQSSRALVRKGKLRFISRNSVAGQIFTILDEQNKPAPQATLWLGGNLYSPDEDGTIAVPFSNNPGRQPIVLSLGNWSSLDFTEQTRETYQLQAAIYVDREQLLSLRTAKLLVRPQLLLNGTPVSLGVLEEIRLLITSTDLDGVVSTKEVSDFKVFDDRETVHEFQVPKRLARLQFQLLAKVQNQSQNQKVDLSSQQTFGVNGIDLTEQIEAMHLAKFGDNYVVDLLGKTGEVKADRPVRLELYHRDYKHSIHFQLQTDNAGRVVLGPLPGIISVVAFGPRGSQHRWPLPAADHSYPAAVHGAAGGTLEIPYMGTSARPERSDFSLLELRGDNYQSDRFEELSLDGSLLKINKLPPGDYSLWIKDRNQQIRLSIAAGVRQGSFVLGEYRKLEVINDRPLQLKPVEVTKTGIRIELQNMNPHARVHLFATRFQPAFNAAHNLARIEPPNPTGFTTPRVGSQYEAGRNIGDEFRYIIDRRFATKFPGNMLERPSLLLNPWAIRSTETGEQRALEGGDFQTGAMESESQKLFSSHGGNAVTQTNDFANLDFLSVGGMVLCNLIPNEQGILELTHEELGPHQQLVVVAVDPQNTASRTVTLPSKELDYLDLRLRNGLDPQQHFTQQKRISFVATNNTLVVPDITSTRFEAFDQLSQVYSLYTALNNNTKLGDFGLLRTWPTLTAEAKREFYLKYACHELHFFLFKKDPEFFKTVVRPFLANKKEKQFLDHWLLEAKVGAFTEPWKFSQLNTFERILFSQQVAGEQALTSRLIRDQYQLLPPDVDRFNHLFQTALRGSSLDTGDALGLRLAVDKLQEKRAFREQAANQASNGPAMASKPASAPVPAAPPAQAAAEMDAAADGKLRKQSAERLERRQEAAKKDFLADDRKRLGQAQFYRKLDKTKEWVESNYYQLPIPQQTDSLITTSAFWKDYAAHDPKQPFFSTNFGEASRNLPEMLAALALLDLPFKPAAHKTEFKGTAMTLTAGSPLIVFHEEIQPAARVAEFAPILVSQNFYRFGERYRQENNEQVDKFVTDEFLPDTVYGCHIVVTNPTSTRKRLDVLMQIPAGAMPVKNGQNTRSSHIILDPYRTETLEYFFYFPKIGRYPHYPVQVAAQAEVLAFAAPFTFNVVPELSNIDKDSWDYISQHGTPAEVVKFLQTQNVLRVNLDRIAWRMQEKEFYLQVTQLLAARHIYSPTLWSYSVKHADVAGMQQFLQFSNQFVAQTGEWLVSPLLVIDPVLRKTYEQMEYRPLVNPRVGQLGRKREILNDRFHQQYHRLLKILSYHRELKSEELLAVTYYLLLQDRVEEALTFFDRVQADQLATRIQYDYCAAYLYFSKSEPQLAKNIAAKYANYPVERWRLAFANVTSQALEIEQQAGAVPDLEDRTQRQTQLAAQAPSFDFTVEARQVQLQFQNLKSVRVNYYLMDIELLFSRNPFVQHDSRQFANILPNVTQQIDLPADKQAAVFPLPAQLANSNVLVEIVGAGVTQSKAYYSNALRVQLTENAGQVRVTRATDNTALPKVYVKVYARMQNGEIRFYKDGYTDLRGRFDYTSLNTDELDRVQKFSLLILSDEFGAVVREANPPLR